MKIQKELYIWVILISISTAFSFAIGKGDRNLLLIGIMYLIPFFLVYQYPSIKKGETSIYLLFISMAFCGLLHFSSFRLSTILYSLLIILTFIYFKRLIYSDALMIKRYMLILKVIIIAYFITLIIQQISIISGLPYVFNQIHTWDESAFKLNVLSPEPSHTARILILLMYSYICMQEIILGRSYILNIDWTKNRYLWLIFLYAMLTMGSGTAFLFLPLFFMKFIRAKHLIYIFPIIILGLFLIMSLDLNPINRALTFGKSVFTMDVGKIQAADHSASFRLVPTLLYFQMFDITQFDTWFGHGIDYDVELFPKIIAGLPEGVGAGGIFPNFLMNYGLISAIFLFLMLVKFCFRKFWSFDTILWLLMIGPEPFNSQLFGVSFVLLCANKYFANYHLQENTAFSTVRT